MDKQLQTKTKLANKRPKKKPMQKASPKKVIVAKKKYLE